MYFYVKRHARWAQWLLFLYLYLNLLCMCKELDIERKCSFNVWKCVCLSKMFLITCCHSIPDSACLIIIGVQMNKWWLYASVLFPLKANVILSLLRSKKKKRKNFSPISTSINNLPIGHMSASWTLNVLSQFVFLLIFN